MVAETRKAQAYRLFADGKTPKAPEVKALGIKAKTAREYYRQYQLGHGNQPSQSGQTMANPTPSAAKLPQVKVAQDIAEANILAISPKEFRMSPTLLWQAREAAIREWNWPADISPEDFLDTYLYESFKQRGILLGAYQVVEKDKG